MELCHSKNFVCKYCNKRYPCGKSLGGHLRSHNIVHLVDDKEKAKQTENCDRMLKIGAEFGGQGQSDYVLNEKLKCFLDSGNACKQLKICRECSKEFQSVKALCGHMACHSEKDKQKEIMYDGSETELLGPMQQRRSRRLRGRTLDVHSSSVTMAKAGSSSSSKIEEEQEEVALCLLMLSRDIVNWDGVNFNVKSSADVNFTTENDQNCASDISELVRMNKLTDRKPGTEIRMDGYYESMNSRIKNTLGTKHCAAKSPNGKLTNNGVKGSRKSKGHKCPFCPRIFRSGQALGGHKRIHFLAGSKDVTFVVKQETRSLLDLNFPPPDFEEMNCSSSFMPW